MVTRLERAAEENRKMVAPFVKELRDLFLKVMMLSSNELRF